MALPDRLDLLDALLLLPLPSFLDLLALLALLPWAAVLALAEDDFTVALPAFAEGLDLLALSEGCAVPEDLVPPEGPALAEAGLKVAVGTALQVVVSAAVDLVPGGGRGGRESQVFEWRGGGPEVNAGLQVVVSGAGDLAPAGQVGSRESHGPGGGGGRGECRAVCEPGSVKLRGKGKLRVHVTCVQTTQRTAAIIASNIGGLISQASKCRAAATHVAASTTHPKGATGYQHCSCCCCSR